MSVVPKERPEMGRHAAEALLVELGVVGPALLGRRGYYRDAMGKVGVNDIGIYDDAIMVVTPTAFATFNANCDPSRQRPGMAMLKAGVWRYQIGTHGLSRPTEQQYTALVQAAPVTVLRYAIGEPAREDTGLFGINIHRGGYSTTSSEGCQTIYPEQWPAFIALVESEMKRHGMATIPYALTERGPS